jgi:cell division septation protein DedD
MRADGGGRREIEFELDLPRLLLVVVVAAVALTGAFFAGRLSVEAPEAPAAVLTPGSDPGDAEREREELGEGGGLFDRADDSIQREPGRQVTEERSLGGRFEVDLGRVAGRREAENLRAAAEKQGVPAMVLGAPGGGYRVAGGPFAEREQAERAARRLSSALGREAAVVEAER